MLKHQNSKGKASHLAYVLMNLTTIIGILYHPLQTRLLCRSY
ncbi:unnamed protein product [Spirodela intermedia]|uniref:Uncharacterized protein n=1 Tax=Spirodela intermedia TaxID=51605 RepID=A0A7I8KSF1_SPIIN|nr:unnamed protein product [Spirodela intermedia]